MIARSLALSVFFAASFSTAAFATCDLPSSEGREDLYGHTTYRSGIDQLNPQFRDSVAALIDAARDEAGYDIDIYSGYRSYEHQKRLWEEGAVKYPDEEVRDNYIARPGESMHQFGLAVDLRANGKRIEMGTKASDWLAKNMGRFGLTRPMSWEGWHVEPNDAAAKKAEYMAGMPLDCQQDFSDMVDDWPKTVLMPWVVQDYKVR